MRALMLAVGLLASTPVHAQGAEDSVALLFELVGAATTPPGNVPRVACNAAICDSPVPVPIRWGIGAHLGGALYFHIRNETYTSTNWRYDPRTLEVRLGVGGSQQSIDSPVYGMSQVFFGYVAYREVRDMESLEQQAAVSTGRGFQVGLMASFPAEQGPPVFGEVAWVQYLDAWPIHDRNRGGFLLRMGGSAGPAFFAARFDGDPGLGLVIGAEAGLLGFVKLHPKAWKKGGS